MRVSSYNQKRPITNTAEPSIMIGSLSSGMGFLALRSLGRNTAFISHVMIAPAKSTPTKTAMSLAILVWTPRCRLSWHNTYGRDEVPRAK